MKSVLKLSWKKAMCGVALAAGAIGFTGQTLALHDEFFSLKDDYARATACKNKLNVGEPCTLLEQNSLRKTADNEVLGRTSSNTSLGSIAVLAALL